MSDGRRPPHHGHEHAAAVEYSAPPAEPAVSPPSLSESVSTPPPADVLLPPSLQPP